MHLPLKMLRPSVTKISKETFAGFLNSFDTVLTDCDGVLWVKNEPYEGSAEVMNRFRELGKRVFFVTNNSTRTRQDYLEKLTQLQFIANKEDVIATAYLSAMYLKNKNFNKKAYVIGPKAVYDELDMAGIKHTDPGPDIIQTTLVDAIASFKKDPEIGAVVVGHDEDFNYLKLLKAASYLKNSDVLFVGTNSDITCVHKNEEIVLPGCGCMLAAISTATGREPFVVGKPNVFISEIIKAEYGVDPKRTLMIGDSCKTDILFGKRCGYQTFLVLTGLTNLNALNGFRESTKPEDQELVPDFFVDKLGDLLPFLKE